MIIQCKRHVQHVDSDLKGGNTKCTLSTSKGKLDDFPERRGITAMLPFHVYTNPAWSPDESSKDKSLGQTALLCVILHMFFAQFILYEQFILYVPPTASWFGPH